MIIAPVTDWVMSPQTITTRNIKQRIYQPHPSLAFTLPRALPSLFYRGIDEIVRIEQDFRYFLVTVEGNNPPPPPTCGESKEVF